MSGEPIIRNMHWVPGFRLRQLWASPKAAGLRRTFGVLAFYVVHGTQRLLPAKRSFRIDTVFAERIGHLVSECDELLGQLDSRARVPNTIDLVIMPRTACNEFLREKYVRLLASRPGVRVIDPRSNALGVLLTYAGRESRRRYFAGKLSLRYYSGPLDHGGLIESLERKEGRQHLELTSEELESGWGLMSQAGFERSRPIACIHVRDRAYLKDAAHHDYRDPPLDVYERLARDLIDEGYSVIRTGSVASSKMDVRSPHFLDYPFWSNKSDFLDIFVYAVCELAIAGGVSGIDCLPIALRRPLLMADLRPLHVPRCDGQINVFTFSRMRRTADGKLLNLRETIENRAWATEDFTQSGIEFVPNTYAEVSGALNDLISLTTRRSEFDSEHMKRQKHFWSEYVRCTYGPDAHVSQLQSGYATISPSFLAMNSDLQS